VLRINRITEQFIDTFLQGSTTSLDAYCLELYMSTILTVIITFKI
jgi:hypothetical protein